MTIQDGKTVGGVVYAKETLSKSSTVEKDGRTYYVVSESTRSGSLPIQRNGRILELTAYVPMPFSRPPNSSMVVGVELENMLMTSNIDLTASGQLPSAGRDHVEVRQSILSVARSGTTYTLLSGGQAGDSSYLVAVQTDGSTTISDTDSIYISFPALGILPDTPGTIRVTIGYVFAGTRIGREYVLRDVVKAQSLLEVEATASDATADLTEAGLTFEPGPNVRADGLAASVGRVALGSSATYTAPDPFDPPYFHVTGDRVMAADGTWLVAPSRSVDASRRTVRTLVRKLASELVIGIEGPTDFLGEDGKVYVSPSADCAPSRDSIVGEDGNRVSVNDLVDEGRYVCIEVDGETEIPEAGPYTFRVKHESTTAAFPAPEVVRELGSLGQGGSVVRIPYLTTDDRYNNRLVVVNRSGRAADYTLSFTPSEGTTATAEEGASGTFPVGRTILHVRDVVTLDDGTEEGGGHTAAELSIVGAASRFDVATWITNRSDGATDSVVYEVQ